MNSNLGLKEVNGMRGHIVVRSHPAGSIDRYRKMIAEAGNDENKKLEVLAEIRKGKVEAENKNLIMKAANVGKDIIVQWLLGITTYPVGINYLAIGTNNTAPAITDIKLGTETMREVISFSADLDNSEAVLQAFFTDANLPNNTYYEAGGFINATATPDSGQIFNHGLFSSGYVKVGGTDTTLEIDIFNT